MRYINLLTYLMPAKYLCDREIVHVMTRNQELHKRSFCCTFSYCGISAGTGSFCCTWQVSIFILWPVTIWLSEAKCRKRIHWRLL